MKTAAETWPPSQSRSTSLAKFYPIVFGDWVTDNVTYARATVSVNSNVRPICRITRLIIVEFIMVMLSINSVLFVFPFLIYSHAGIHDPKQEDAHLHHDLHQHPRADPEDPDGSSGQPQTCCKCLKNYWTTSDRLAEQLPATQEEPEVSCPISATADQGQGRIVPRTPPRLPSFIADVPTRSLSARPFSASSARNTTN